MTKAGQKVYDLRNCLIKSTADELTINVLAVKLRPQWFFFHLILFHFKGRFVYLQRC